ncbi:MAG: RelA/SpoT family protein [Bacteroides sp.]|nr:RelA/SpoT family protein [Bacteroides sp.]
MYNTTFTVNDRAAAYRQLRKAAADALSAEDWADLKALVRQPVKDDSEPVALSSEAFKGLDEAWQSMATAAQLCRSIAADRNMVVAILLHPLHRAGIVSSEAVTGRWGEDVVTLVDGLDKLSELYERHGAVASDNFRNLMLTLARDIRVVIIMIIDRLVVMRAINHHPDQEMVHRTAMEAGYLYAPLAHRLGLYKVKGELEDLMLKYTNRDMYSRIARKLNDTKANRDAYIHSFIEPVKRALEAQGLKFEIKGRTKSIYSIWNKMMKQHNDVEQIYDLFAIRIILDTPIERERSECWLAYSIVTDMYQPNPSRLKDWLSVPKSNGYESLHITVLGPEGKWVEVQIRTRRMDEIAETGVAAHWKYKGIKSENTLDTWMNHVREILEDTESTPMTLMRNLNMDLYSKEVFVFTPKGDLYKLPLGATILDFAFMIHSNLGCRCVGGRVNQRSCKLNYRLRSGDTVEILTSATQQPKLDWLQIVVTSKARNKIRQAVNEINNRRAELAKELLARRLKNRKIEVDESTMMRLIKKRGFKTVTQFYNAIADEQIDPNDIIEQYLQMLAPDATPATDTRSAEEFTLQTSDTDNSTVGGGSDDVLVIGEGIKGVNYRLAKCCNPIYGDDVFGFISSEGVIKIHRRQCPNAPHIFEKYPYRTIATRWSGKEGNRFVATLSVVGTDDIGIVTNITSIISKESKASLRNISIDSHDSLFDGYLVVGVESKRVLDDLIKKIATVKGVKNVQRTN